MYQRREEPTLGELFANLTQEIGDLVRQEVALARTEFTQKASRVGQDVAFLAIGGAVAYAGLLALLAAAALILAALGMPLWLSALLIGAIVLGVGYYLVNRGMTALKREDVTPRRTLESLREDRDWMREQLQ